MTRPASKNSGFTLIELLIVVVILSTLAAIVVPQFASSSDSAKEAAAKSSLSGIRSALAVYQTDKGSYPFEGDSTALTMDYCSGFTGTNATSNDGKLLHTLSLYSNGSGQVCDAKSDTHPQGPYLRARAFPTNPLSNTNTIDVSAASILGVSASVASTAWLYQPDTGEFIINDADLDEL